MRHSPAWCWLNRYDSPRCRLDPGSVRASTNHQFATCAVEVQIFGPSINHWSASSTGRVRTAARSEPASGSEYPWHHSSRTATIGGRKRRCGAGVPNAISVGPSSSSPKWFTRAGTPDRAYSSSKTTWCSSDAPRPPCSTGQPRQVQPAAARCRSQASRSGNASCSKNPLFRGVLAGSRRDDPATWRGRDYLGARRAPVLQTRARQRTAVRPAARTRGLGWPR